MILEACDGCGTTTGPLTPEGQLDPAVYCPACLTVWQTFEAAAQRKRSGLVAEFTAWRVEQLASLRATFRKLPDDPGPGR